MSNNTKGYIFITFFRLSSFFSSSFFLKIIGIPIRIFYKILIQWVFGIDIPDTTKIGKGFKLYHGQGLIIHKDVIIGDNVSLRHNTTIGEAHKNGGCPKINNNVTIGANSVIIGGVEIGDNSIIGAGSVVVKDVAPNTVVVGNPAKKIKTNA